MATLDQLERSALPAKSGNIRPRGRSRRSVMSRRSHKSVLSTRSNRSILSIRSEGSILSIGSAYSILSIGSVGSVLSVGSIGSFFSLGSAFSGLSRWSLCSWMGVRAAPDPRPPLTVVPDEPDLCRDPTCHCQT
jgi:hypothetical protein